MCAQSQIAKGFKKNPKGNHPFRSGEPRDLDRSGLKLGVLGAAGLASAERCAHHPIAPRRRSSGPAGGR